MTWALAVAGLVPSALSPLHALAQQVAPSRVTPETLQPAAPSAPPQISLPAAAGLTAPPNAENLSVRPGRVDVDGTFPGLEETTASVLAPLRAGTVTVAKIYEVANDLERAYADAGYFLARVAIPAQQLVDGGPLKLTVIDGVIERIDAKEVPERQREVVIARLNPLIGRHRLTLDEMERRLLLVSDIPGVQVRSVLSPGDTPGGTLLELQGTHTLANGSLGFNNSLPASLGPYVLNASASLNSPLGLGEQTYLSIMSTPEMFPQRLRVIGGGAAVPIGVDGLTVNPEYTNSRARPAPPSGFPATQGDFERFAFRASYPVIRGRNENLSIQGSVEYLTEQLIPIGFATKLYLDEYEALRLRAVYTFQPLPNNPLQLTAGISRGISGRSATAALPLSRLGASPTFTTVFFEAGMQHPLPAGLLISVTARGQTSFGRPLMLSEQFSLDGGAALSAFAEGSISVDQGATLRAELSRPFAMPIFSHTFVFSPYLFAAGGFGNIVLPTVVERADIGAGSAGVGLRTDTGVAGLFGSTVAFEFARKFSDVPTVRTGYRANLSVNLRF
jgi:hemolysin activation/secretion protein